MERTIDRTQLRSQRLREVNFQGDALRLGMNWTEEDLAAEEAVRVLTGQPPQSRVNAGGPAGARSA